MTNTAPYTRRYYTHTKAGSSQLQCWGKVRNKTQYLMTPAQLRIITTVSEITKCELKTVKNKKHSWHQLPISDSQRPTSSYGKKVISQSDYIPIQAIVTPRYRTLQSTIRYDTGTVIRRTWVTAAGRNFACKLAAKPLQTETWVPLRAYRNSSSLYPTIPLLTPNDVLLVCLATIHALHLRAHNSANQR